MPAYGSYTAGFEIETFSYIYCYGKYLRKLGFTDIDEDGSGPLETASPAFPLFSSRLPLAAVYASVLLDYRSWETMVEEDCDEYDDCEYRTAGTHCHVRDSRWRSGSDAYPLFKYLAEYLPLFQPFFAFYIKRSNDRLKIEWGCEEERRDWAGEPCLDCYDPDDRRYWAVTPNPSGRSKPFTLEIRICETAPQICLAALVYLVAGYENGIKFNHDVEYYQYSIPVQPLKQYIALVESTVNIPAWAREIARLTLGGKRPLTILALLEAGIVTPSDVIELIVRLGLTKPTNEEQRVKIGNAVIGVRPVAIDWEKVEEIGALGPALRDKLQRIMPPTIRVPAAATA